MSRAIFNLVAMGSFFTAIKSLKMVSLPLLLLVMLTGALAGSVEQTHGDETLTTLLTRGRELVEKSMTIWWLPPLVSAIFIISMHVWVYGVIHLLWYITSLLSSKVHVNKT